MDYELSIKQSGKNYRQYNINGESFIGVQKNEPFEIHFKNNTWQTIQVRFSLDGTDIVTGEPASTKPTGKMWLVKGNTSMSLKAWPEQNHGGSAFVFTDPDKGVATNTHGVKAGIGLIAAAVYIENQPVYNQFVFNGFPLTVMGGGGLYKSAVSYNSSGLLGSNVTKGASSIRRRSAGGGQSAEVKTKGFVLGDSKSSVDFSDDSIAVGAGDFTQQEITTATGLNKPVLNDIIQIRYLSWPKLEKLIAQASPASNAFPGDPPEKRVNLKKVPKTKTKTKSEEARFA